MPHSQPVILGRDSETGDRFLVYSTDQGVRIELRYEGDTLWLTQPQIADLFSVTRQSVNTHISNIYEEGEVDRSSTCKEILQVQGEGGRDVKRKLLIHNLDVIIAVGYRVSSKQGTLFRRWATDKLVQFATKGFVIDSVQLKSPGARDRIAELRDIIRDIRSDEANIYRELKQICAMCQDYDGNSAIWQDFFKSTQAKLIFAVTGSTPSEILKTRADAREPNMGLQTWRIDNIRKTDVTISKNFLGSSEIKELNRLTTILLDILEDQMDIGRLTTMLEASKLLDDQLKSLNRTVLDHGGSVKTSEAQRHAQEQYEVFKSEITALRHREADRVIKSIQEIRASLPKHK
jgi:hypothetical protein